MSLETGLGSIQHSIVNPGPPSLRIIWYVLQTQRGHVCITCHGCARGLDQLAGHCGTWYAPFAPHMARGMRNLQPGRAHAAVSCSCTPAGSHRIRLCPTFSSFPQQWPPRGPGPAPLEHLPGPRAAAGHCCFQGGPPRAQMGSLLLQHS